MSTDRVSLFSALGAAGLLALAVGFGHVALRAHTALVFPYQIDPEEGFILNQAMRLGRGQSIYSPIDQPPFLAGTYAPVFPYVVSRGPGLALELALGGLLFLILLEGGRSRAGWAAAGAAGFLLCAQLSHQHEISAREGLKGLLFPSMSVVRTIEIAWAAGLAVWALRSRGLGMALLAGALLVGLCEIHSVVLAPLLKDLRPDSLVWARTPAVTAELGCGLLIGVGVFRMGRRNVVAAAFAALLFFVCSENYNWTGFARVDYLALFFNLAGLLLIADGARRFDCAALSILFFTLALLTKQSQIMAPVAGCLYMLWRWPKWGMAFAGALGLSVGAVVMALQALTDGQYLIHTVRYNANVFYWDQLWVYARHLWRFETLIWPALALALAGQGVRALHLWRAGQDAFTPGESVNPWHDPAKAPRRLPDEPDWTPLFLILCLLSLAGFAKAGVSYNYLIDPWAAICLYLGVRVGRELTPGPWLALKPHGSLRAAHALGMAAVVLSVGHGILALSPLPPRSKEEAGLRRPRFTITASNPGRREWEMGRAVEQAIGVAKASGREFLTDLPIFAIRAGVSPQWQPFIMAQLAREGKWDDAPMVRDLNRRRYGLLVFYTPVHQEGGANFTASMLDAIRSNYRLTQSIGGSPIFNYYIYAPRTDAP